jgi:hypothetical protein
MTTPSVPLTLPWIGRSSRVLYHGSGIVNLLVPMWGYVHDLWSAKTLC